MTVPGFFQSAVVTAHFDGGGPNGGDLESSRSDAAGHSVSSGRFQTQTTYARPGVRMCSRSVRRIMTSWTTTAVVAGAVAWAAATLPPTVGAAVVTFDHDWTCSGTTPAGPGPWLTATFTDAAPGEVTLTLDAAGLDGVEFVSSWAFNLDPAFHPGELTFSAPTKVGSFKDPTITAVADAIDAGPAHGFDVELSFAKAKADRFGAGEKVTYTLGGPTGLSASAFDDHLHDDYRATAHVQALLGGGSAWVASVPEPVSLATVAGAVAFTALRRRRRRPAQSFSRSPRGGALRKIPLG